MLFYIPQAQKPQETMKHVMKLIFNIFFDYFFTNNHMANATLVTVF